MKRWTAFIALLLLLATLLGVPALHPIAQTPSGDNITYIVQQNDTLYKIAAKFGVAVDDLIKANGITDPNSISPGQKLIIPKHDTATQAATAAVGTAQPLAPAAVPATYVVVAGDDLVKIAAQFNTTVPAILRLNGLTNPDKISVGQTLKIPGGATTTNAAGSSAPTNSTKNIPFTPGITVFVNLDNAAHVADWVGDLGVTWVRIPVRWRDLEPTKGNYKFTPLDAEIAPLGDFSAKILFTVSGAPDWARSTNLENGPPKDFADFANFMKALAEHYKGTVLAYEIWNEPNLRREWNGLPLSAVSYVDLLKQAYAAVKQVDPSIIVVSAGLAPTGLHDGVNALSDREFLTQAYAAGLASVSDAIGVHAEGWVNPPGNKCCTSTSGVNGWNNDRTFFFQDSLLDYRQIMVKANDNAKLLWVTQFGWGSSKSVSDDPKSVSPNLEFVAFNNEAQQAQYIPQAFEMGRTLGYIGPMFVYNLNACDFFQPGTSDYGACFYALITPQGVKRPVYDAIKAVHK